MPNNSPATVVTAIVKSKTGILILISASEGIIVPTGGIPMMLFGKEPDAHIDGAPIVNGVTVVIKAAEMAVKLKRLGVSVASRIPQSGFALPSAQTLDEFLRHG